MTDSSASWFASRCTHAIARIHLRGQAVDRVASPGARVARFLGRSGCLDVAFCSLVRHAAAVVSALALVLLLSACAGVPAERLQTYSSAFDEAKSAAALVYAGAAPALLAPAGAPLGAQTKDRLSFPVSLGSAIFDREGCGAAVASSESLRARCLAMDALKAYNQALLDIATGKSSQSALDQVDRALRSVSSLAAISGSAEVAEVLSAAVPVVPVLQGILGEALKARDRVALWNELVKGAPQVQALLDALRKDVVRLYAIRRKYAILQLNGIVNSIDEALEPVSDALLAHSPPHDAAVVSALRLLDQRFESIFSSPEPDPGTRLGSMPDAGPGSRALDAASVAVIDRQLLVVEAQVSKFKSVSLDFMKYAQALDHYDNLLANVQAAFAQLLTASNNPFSAGGGTEQLLESLMAVRAGAQQIRQLLVAAK